MDALADRRGRVGIGKRGKNTQVVIVVVVVVVVMVVVGPVHVAMIVVFVGYS